MRVDLIRHGQCADDVFLRGRCDSVLSEKGQRQMRAALASVPPSAERIVCSPARRCVEFATEYFNAQSIDVDASWQERDFGAWDGLSYAQVDALDALGLAQYLDQPFDYTPPNAEPFNDYQQRIDQAWLSLLDSAMAKNQQHLVVIGHGGPMRLMVRSLLGLSLPSLFQLHIGYGARITFEMSATQWGTFSKLIEVVQYDESI